jgi:hypothetical protein
LEECRGRTRGHAKIAIILFAENKNPNPITLGVKKTKKKKF